MADRAIIRPKRWAEEMKKAQRIDRTKREKLKVRIPPPPPTRATQSG